MRTRISQLALLILLPALAGPAYSEEHFICFGLSEKQVDQDGKFKVPEWFAHFQDRDESHYEFTFDPNTGDQKYNYSEQSWKFKVLDSGSETGTLKAVRVHHGELSVVLETLYINIGDNMQFLYTENNNVSSGLCRLDDK